MKNNVTQCNPTDPVLAPSFPDRNARFHSHVLQDNSAATISRKPCNEAVDNPHTIWCGRRCESCSSTFSEKHGRRNSHLHPAEVDAKTLTGTLAERIEGHLGFLRKLRSR